mmetsp:Transcript_11723/g.10181  ORF Transcript_11723/g.10181 Transcript_11723/m.10181 type:complete len:169 (+) Transcript_11723:721-1227(+)
MEVTVEVKGINYNIHRKLMVTDEIPFTKFARIIVTAMGWAGWRNWEFQVNNMNIMVPPDDDADREKSSSQRLYADEINVADVKLQTGDKFLFVYGADDHPWIHNIIIEKNHTVERSTKANNELGRAVNHGVVLTGLLRCPRDELHPSEFEQAIEAFENDPIAYDRDWK